MLFETARWPHAGQSTTVKLFFRNTSMAGVWHSWHLARLSIVGFGFVSITNPIMVCGLSMCADRPWRLFGFITESIASLVAFQLPSRRKGIFRIKEIYPRIVRNSRFRCAKIGAAAFLA
jgi:hypothetical protein